MYLHADTIFIVSSIAPIVHCDEGHVSSLVSLLIFDQSQTLQLFPPRSHVAYHATTETSTRFPVQVPCRTYELYQAS